MIKIRSYREWNENRKLRGLKVRHEISGEQGRVSQGLLIWWLFIWIRAADWPTLITFTDLAGPKAFFIFILFTLSIDITSGKVPRRTTGHRAGLKVFWLMHAYACENIQICEKRGNSLTDPKSCIFYNIFRREYARKTAYILEPIIYRL